MGGNLKFRGMADDLGGFLRQAYWRKNTAYFNLTEQLIVPSSRRKGRKLERCSCPKRSLKYSTRFCNGMNLSSGLIKGVLIGGCSASGCMGCIAVDSNRKESVPFPV